MSSFLKGQAAGIRLLQLKGAVRQISHTKSNYCIIPCSPYTTRASISTTSPPLLLSGQRKNGINKSLALEAKLRNNQAMPLVTISSSILDSLKAAKIIPDVIDPDFVPSALIQASFDGKNQAFLGNTLDPSEAQSKPAINITSDGTAGELYTIAMTDPDAPTKGDKKWSEYCHYLITDVKLKETGNGAGEVSATDVTSTGNLDLGDAKVIANYLGPAPPPKTGKHRYVILAFEQESKRSPQPPPSLNDKNRANWGTGKPGYGARDWAKTQNLKLVGVNFFYAQNRQQ